MSALFWAKKKTKGEEGWMAVTVVGRSRPETDAAQEQSVEEAPCMPRCYGRLLCKKNLFRGGVCVNVERSGCESDQRRQNAADERVVFLPSIVPAPSAGMAAHFRMAQQAHH